MIDSLLGLRNWDDIGIQRSTRRRKKPTGVEGVRVVAELFRGTGISAEYGGGVSGLCSLIALSPIVQCLCQFRCSPQDHLLGQSLRIIRIFGQQLLQPLEAIVNVRFGKSFLEREGKRRIEGSSTRKSKHSQTKEKRTELERTLG